MKSKIKKILVTGGAGFMGKHLVDELVKRDCIVYSVDDLSGGFMRNVNSKCNFTKLDLRKRQETTEYINTIKPDLIYHLAADATEGRSQFTPIECTERNYNAYLNVLIPAIKNNTKRIVLTSSMAVYGNQQPPFREDIEPRPEDVYGTAKAAMENITKVLSAVHNFEYVILRPHNVYGPDQNMADPYRNVMGIFINRLLNNKSFYIYGDGKQKRSFSYIDDIIPLFIKTGFLNNISGEIFNVGAGPEEAVTINELAKIILEEFLETKNIPKEFQPIYLSDRPQEVKFAFSTDDKAREILGYKSKISLRDGIKKMIDSARDIGYQQPKYLAELELYSDDMPLTWKNKLI